MKAYQVYDRIAGRNHYCIAPGPAVALNLVARQWALPLNDLQVYDKARGFWLQWEAA